jgi:hypothetical protein
MIGSNDVAKALLIYDAALPLIGKMIFADFMPRQVVLPTARGRSGLDRPAL